MRRRLLVLIYLLILTLPLITWVRDGGAGEFNRWHAIQRILGLYAFTLLVLQMAIGPFMNQLRQMFGGVALKIHIWQGVIAFGLACGHPLAYILRSGVNSALFNFGDLNQDLGKLGFTLLLLAVGAGLLRTKISYWRWIHRLNYLVLPVIWVHSWNLGSDTHYFPMVILYYLAPVVWVCSLTYKLLGNKIHTLWESETL